MKRRIHSQSQVIIKPFRKYGAGFTMVEIIMVLIIVAIIGVTIAPKMVSNETFQNNAYMNDTFLAIQYANRYAVSSGCHVRVSVNTAGYSLFTGDAGVCRASFANLNALMNNPVTGNTFENPVPTVGLIGGGDNFYFDHIGRPRDNANDLLLANAVVQFDNAGFATFLDIEFETGYVHFR